MKTRRRLIRFFFFRGNAAFFRRKALALRLQQVMEIRIPVYSGCGRKSDGDAEGFLRTAVS